MVVETGKRTIVAGVDTSAACLNMARWAALEASARGATLRLVHASVFGPGEPVPHPDDLPLQSGYRWIERAVAAAGEVAPGVVIETEVALGIAPELLAAHSRTAELLVVGSHGLGGLSGVLVGSVALKVAANAFCPVVVVRGPVPRTGGTVLVGVDATPESDLAWELALETAARRQVPLVVAHAWHDALLAGDAHVAARRASELRALEDRARGWRAKYPDVEFRLQVVCDRDAGRALLGLSGDAQLVVVGSRGRGPVAGGILGSTGNTLLSQVSCPVMVAHEGRLSAE